MTEQSIEAYVLLSTVPADMGEVLSSIQEGMGDPLAGAPLMPAFQMGVNGSDLQIGASGQPVTDPQLQADLAVSPLRKTLEPAVTGHVAFVALSISPPADFLQPLMTWVNVLAYLADRDDAAAIWLPYQQLVTTDVMLIGSLEDDPVLTLTGVHAMRIDETSSLAFTSGLAALGGRELQLRGPGDPATQYGALRSGIASELRQQRLPQAGATLVLGQQAYQLVEGTGVVDGRPVLDMVPTAPGQAQEPPKKRRRWPFG